MIFGFWDAQIEIEMNNDEMDMNFPLPLFEPPHVFFWSNEGMSYLIVLLSDFSLFRLFAEKRRMVQAM